MPPAMLTDNLAKLRRHAEKVAAEQFHGDSVMKPVDRIHAVGFYSNEHSNNYYIVELVGGTHDCANIQYVLNKKHGWQGVKVIPKLSR